MFDPLFSYRLRDIVLAADLVISGRPGTEVIYSALLGRPVWIIPEAYAIQYSSSHYAELHQRLVSIPNRSLSALSTLFAKPARELSGTQISFVQDIAGVSQQKTARQLREILLDAELLYRAAQGVAPDSRFSADGP